MKRLVLTTAIVLGLAAPALADDQIARNLGVEPGQYSQSELARLKAVQDSKDSGEYDRFAALERKFAGDAVSTQSVGVEPGEAQLAANLGLDPNDFTLAELVRIKAAKNAGEYDEVAQYISMYAGETVSTQSAGGNGGQRQIAARAGIDPDTHSLTETVIAYTDRLSDG